MSDQTTQVAVLGGGSAAERLAGILADADRDVTLVERRLVGGECPYFACIPSKVMLLSAADRHRVGRAHLIGATAAELDLGSGAEAFARAAGRRDEKAEHHDDSGHVEELRSAGVELVRGDGRVAAPGVLTVDTPDGEVRLRHDTLVLATGSCQRMPDIEGLAEANPWTFEEAWTATQLPASMLVIGAGAVGCEIAQAYARFGCQVTLVQRSQVMGHDAEPESAADLAEVLTADGVDVREHSQARRVQPAVAGHVVTVESDSGELEEVTVEVVVVATGQSPVTHGMGLEVLGIGPDALSVDAQCRVEGVQGVYAIGDVTGVAPYTHTANYQGRIAARHILGRDVAADLRAVPRTIYTSPEAAAVGVSASSREGWVEDGPVDAGLVKIAFDLAETARGWVDDERAGHLVLVADRRSRRLVGASLVAPAAAEAINEFALAIRAEVSVDVLADVVHPFPAWSEGFGPAIDRLLDALG